MPTALAFHDRHQTSAARDHSTDVAAPDELAIEFDRTALHAALVERRQDLENMHAGIILFAMPSDNAEG